MEQGDDALIAAAISCDDEAETTHRIDQARREIFVLGCEVGEQVLDAVVTKITVQLADDRIFLIVEGDRGGLRTFEVERSDALAAHLSDGLLD